MYMDEMEFSGDGGGNTNIPSVDRPKGRSLQHKHFFFTFNNYHGDDIVILQKTFELY